MPSAAKPREMELNDNPAIGNDPPIFSYRVIPDMYARELTAIATLNVRIMDQRWAVLVEDRQFLRVSKKLKITPTHSALGPSRKTAAHWIIESNESSVLPYRSNRISTIVKKRNRLNRINTANVKDKKRKWLRIIVGSVDRINQIIWIFFTDCGVRLMKTQDKSVKMQFRFSGKISCLSCYPV